MARIFIDTNIYLEFFKTSDPSLLKHAKALSQTIKDEVFVSQQLVDEVERNRVRIASQFLDEQLKRLILPQISLPGFPPDVAKKMTSVAKEAADIKKEGQRLASDYLKNLSAGTDETSKALMPIFSNAQRPSKEVLKRARDRKERGNPPGKTSDPLGDQISWEQFLDQISRGPIWIVTKDSDYLTKFDGRLHLNSFLQRELTAKLPGLDVRVFDSIVDCLKDFDSQKEKDAPPTIPPEDRVHARRVEHLLNDYWDDDRTVCEICDPGDDHSPALVEYTPRRGPINAKDPDSLYEEGTCNYCNGTSIRCRTCGEVTAVSDAMHDEEIQCEGGCGFAFKIESNRDRDGSYWTSIEVLSPPSK